MGDWTGKLIGGPHDGDEGVVPTPAPKMLFTLSCRRPGACALSDGDPCCMKGIHWWKDRSWAEEDERAGGGVRIEEYRLSETDPDARLALYRWAELTEDYPAGLGEGKQLPAARSPERQEVLASLSCALSGVGRLGRPDTRPTRSEALRRPEARLFLPSGGPAAVSWLPMSLLPLSSFASRASAIRRGGGSPR